MKTLFVTILGLLSLNICAQQSSEISPAFESTDGITFDQVKNVFEINGDVKYSDEIIQFSNASKVVFDKTKNEMIIESAESFTFNGKIVIETNNDFKGIIRYKLGEQIAYLN